MDKQDMNKNIQALAERIEAAYKEINAIRDEINKVISATESKFTPDESAWVDLGLPSGRLWYGKDVEGYFTFDEAIDVFGENLPSATAMAELYENCEWEWDIEKRGYKVTGPNGKSIFLPASGYKESGGNVISDDVEGNYWTKCVNKISQALARHLYFYSGHVNPLNNGHRPHGFSVRPVREFN